MLEHHRSDSDVKLEVWSPGKGSGANVQDAMAAFREGKGRASMKGESFGPTCGFHSILKLVLRGLQGFVGFEEEGQS